MALSGCVHVRSTPNSLTRKPLKMRCGEALPRTSLMGPTTMARNKTKSDRARPPSSSRPFAVRARATAPLRSRPRDELTASSPRSSALSSPSSTSPPSPPSRSPRAAPRRTALRGAPPPPRSTRASGSMRRATPSSTCARSSPRATTRSPTRSPRSPRSAAAIVDPHPNFARDARARARRGLCEGSERSLKRARTPKPRAVWFARATRRA